MKLYILFQGFGQTTNDWNGTIFYQKLMQKGEVFIYRNKWIEQTNDYPLSYLTMEGFMDDVHSNLIKQIPNARDFRWIPIGESFGGCFALTFSILFKNQCNCCVLLDNPPYFTLKNNKHRIAMTEQMMGSKFKILSEKNFTTKNSDYLINYGVISFAKYIQKNIIGKKLPVKILGFYNIMFPDFYEKEFQVYHNTALFDEINKLKERNFNYTLYLNAGHMIYLDKNAVENILENI
jgi:carboxypeptidase C (cathepsin A)